MHLMGTMQCKTQTTAVLLSVVCCALCGLLVALHSITSSLSPLKTSRQNSNRTHMIDGRLVSVTFQSSDTALISDARAEASTLSTAASLDTGTVMVPAAKPGALARTIIGTSGWGFAGLYTLTVPAP